MLHNPRETVTKTRNATNSSTGTEGGRRKEGGRGRRREGREGEGEDTLAGPVSGGCVLT